MDEAGELWWVSYEELASLEDEAHRLRSRELALPGWQRDGDCVRALPLQIVDADDEVSERRHDARGRRVSDERAIFAKTDVAGVMNPVLDRAPVAAHRLVQGLVAGFLMAETAHVVAQLRFRRFL